MSGPFDSLNKHEPYGLRARLIRERDMTTWRQEKTRQEEQRQRNRAEAEERRREQEEQRKTESLPRWAISKFSDLELRIDALEQQVRDLLTTNKSGEV